MNRCSSSILCTVALAFLLGTGGRAAEIEAPVSLPPYLVESSGLNRPWRYARSPEFEILSRCEDAVTQEIAENYHSLHQTLTVILPERFQVKYDVPRTLLLYDQDLLSAMAKTVFAPPSGGAPSTLAPTVLRNPRFCDLDAMTVFVSVQPGLFPSGRLSDFGSAHSRPRWTSLTPNYVEDLIAKRTPSLPEWFIAGFNGLYRKMHFSEGTIEVGAVFWVSETETRGLRKNKEIPTLLPLGKFFERASDAANIERWFAQSELFVRWGLDDENGKRRDAFWQFVDRSCTEPITEAMFQECFAMDYGHAAATMQRYLMHAVFQSAIWRNPGSGPLATLEIRDATRGEIARIKGDWERLAAGYVRSNTPAFEEKYFGQARRTLRRAYDTGDRNLSLLATMGLLECDAGEAAAGREFLEAAIRGGVVRPRAFFEAARLRFVENLAHAEGSDGRLSSTQAAEVLAPLAAARRQAPLLRQVYELTAEVWTRSSEAPSRDDLATLEEGVRLFPQSIDLIYRTASLFAAEGNRAQTARLIALGIHAAPNDASRERFEKLRDSVATGSPHR
jgi:hypothetical protein